jgi:predicted permease
MTAVTPPRLAQWLLRHTLPRGVEGETILGDLIEEFRERSAQRRPAALWYWSQALSLSARYRGRGRRSMMFRGFWPGVLSDIRYACRTLGGSPAFAAVAVLSIALGVGANTAVFTLFDQVLLRRLPVNRPQDLVLLTSRGTQYGNGWGDGNELSYPMYEDLRGNNTVFAGMFCRFGIPISVSSGDRTERVDSELVSGTYFPVLGVAPARGRLIEPDDDTARDPQPVVVLSHDYWTGRFAADPGIVGTTLLLNNHRMTVVGVAPDGFYGTNLGKAAQVFAPIRLAPDLTPISAPLTDRRMRWLNVFGRLGPNVAPRQAQAALQPFYASRLELEVREPGFARASGDVKARFLKNTIDVRPAGEGKSDLRRQLSGPLSALMGIVGAVLLIACANVANLLLARATTRQREIAIRLAIGASRRRIVQQLLIESVLLALIGGAAGLVLAAWGSRLLLGFFVSPDEIVTVSASPDDRVLVFTLVVSAVTGLLFGLAPAWQGAAPALAPTLQSGAGSVIGGAGRLRRALVISEVALALLLLIGAGLFIRTLHNLAAADAGFDTAHILSFSVDPGENGYDAVRARLLVKTVLERLRSSPGVAAAGIASHALLEGGSWNNYMTIEGRPVEDVGPAAARHNHLTLNNLITPGYFRAMGMRVVAGRDFDDRDELTSAPAAPPPPLRVAIANEQFVRQYLGGERALGRHVGFGADPGTPTPTEIVGVVSDAKYTSIRDEIQPQLFFPYLEGANPRDFIAYVRTAADPAAMIRTVRDVVHDLDPTLPVHHVQTLEAQVDRSLTSERLLASLSAVFSLLATTLAMVGLYGVMAYMVTRRTREIGIRMALGAQTRDVAALVLHDVASIVAIGVALALPLAWALSRLVKSQLYGVAPGDPAAIAAAIGLLVIVASIAGAIPAWRAAWMNPTTALRRE